MTWIKRVFNHSWISIKSAHLRSLRVRQEICWFRQFAGEVFAREDMGNLADLRWRGHGASQCQIQIRMHKYRKDMGNSVDLTGGGGMRMQKQIASDPEKNQSSPILLQIKCHRHSTCCLASWWKTWLWTLGQRDEFLEACTIYLMYELRLPIFCWFKLFGKLLDSGWFQLLLDAAAGGEETNGCSSSFVLQQSKHSFL